MPKHRVQLSFSKDASACRQAPPSPCPLTLFAMFLALARGVPEAGLTFALSMMTGVELTLAAVAALVIVGRDWFVGIVAGHDASTQRLARILKGITGGMLIMICLNEFWL